MNKAETIKARANAMRSLLMFPDDRNSIIALMGVLGALYGDAYNAGHKDGVASVETKFSFDELWGDA